MEEGLVQQPQGPQSVLVPIVPRGLEKQGLGGTLAGTEMTTFSKLCNTPKRPTGFILPQGSVSLLPNPSSLVTINVRARAIRRLCLDK